MTSPTIDDPNLPLATLFTLWPETPAVFLKHKMLCFGCPIAPFHTISIACAEYDLAEELFRAEVRLAAGL